MVFDLLSCCWCFLLNSDLCRFLFLYLDLVFIILFLFRIIIILICCFIIIVILRNCLLDLRMSLNLHIIILGFIRLFCFFTMILLSTISSSLTLASYHWPFSPLPFSLPSSPLLLSILPSSHLFFCLLQFSTIIFPLPILLSLLLSILPFSSLLFFPLQFSTIIFPTPYLIPLFISTSPSTSILI